MADEHVKLLIRFFSSVLNEWTVESLWAMVVDKDKGLYKIDNIPFYAPISCDDIVYAQYDEDEEELLYKETIEHSGNSTIQVFVCDDSVDVDGLRNAFTELQCETEKFDSHFISLHVPVDVDYKIVESKLIELKKSELISFDIGNLSTHHRFYI